MTGEKEKILQLSAIALLSETEKEYATNLMKIIETDKINDEEFETLYKKLQEFFEESEMPENINSISNLALLDATINRSYKNAAFPIKRKIIIENDMHGTFVPICTKNVFLKSYSKKLLNIMHWNKADAKDYLAEIKKTLEIYLPNQEEINEN